jgi:hypothetical protein
MPWQVQAVPVLIAGNTIINPTGLFTYNSSGPGAGNLAFSIANAGVTADSFNNTVIPDGACAYNGSTAAFLGEGSIQFQNSAGFIAAGNGAQIIENADGQLSISSGATALTDTPSTVLIGSAGHGGGKTRFDVFAQRSSFNGSGWPSLGTAPNDANSGTTWVAGERTFMNNNWVAYMNSIDSALNSMFLG